MSNNKQRFLYSCIFTLIACLITMYVSYARVVKESKIGLSKPANAEEHKLSQGSGQDATMISYLESSQDSKKAFSSSTEVKVGLPDILEEAELTAPNGIIYADGQASIVKIRLISTMWKKMRLNFYDEKDHLLFSSEEPVVLRAAETYGSGASSFAGDPTICTLTSINSQKKSKVTASYRGSLTFAIRPGQDNTHTISVINTLPLEDYLKGVVPSEVPARFDNEALKAMACVARSYTLSNFGRHDKDGYDLCSGVHCHVYGGAGVENANVNAQIEATKGMIICKNEFLADTRYHAVCGGMGESIENVWDMAQPVSYLTASSDTVSGLAWNSSAPVEYISDYDNNGYEDYYAPEQIPENNTAKVNLSAIVENTPELETKFRAFIDNPSESYCKNASRFRWHADYSLVNFQKMLEESLPELCGAQPLEIGNLVDIKVTKRTGSGRVAELSIATDKGNFTVSGDKIRWLTSGGKIGASGLKSTLFYIDKTENGSAIVIKGGGWGHGVGLCQEGAQGRAQAGQSYVDIIKHYYPGCELQSAN